MQAARPSDRNNGNRQKKNVERERASVSVCQRQCNAAGVYMQTWYQIFPAYINDCETVGIPPLMSRKTLGILDGGRGGAVDRSWRRRGIRGVDKGGA